MSLAILSSSDMLILIKFTSKHLFYDEYIGTARYPRENATYFTISVPVKYTAMYSKLSMALNCGVVWSSDLVL